MALAITKLAHIEGLGIAIIIIGFVMALFNGHAFIYSGGSSGSEAQRGLFCHCYNWSK